VQLARVVPFGIDVPGSRVESPDAQATQQIRARLGME